MPTPDFHALLTDATLNGTCLGFVLSRRRAGSDYPADKLSVRPIQIGGERRYQFAARIANQETHENLRPAEAVERVTALFGPVFEHGHLFTPTADYTARYDRRGALLVKRTRPSKSAVSTSHNRAKSYLIPEGTSCPFLAQIGVMTPDGRVRAAMQHKFRQINRFLELVNDVIPDLPPGPLRVVDFGCGKSYLTFALHHLLTVIHHRDVEILGLDRNPAVVGQCAEVAGRLGCRGLEFRVGDIAGHAAGGKVHLAVSLHACDTATDDALAKALEWDADVILAVPCCQHEVAATMRPVGVSALVEHGILRERLAALATDALRAKALEVRGYRAQVVEFIDLEHTAKNILIRAVRRRGDRFDCAASLAEYDALKRTLGLGYVAIDRLLRIDVARQTNS